MKTIIYGGAFNPPTIAHQIILDACVTLASEQNAEVWVLPSGNRRDKTITVPEQDRLLFLHEMVNATPNPGLVKIETSELHRPEPIETYDTIKELKNTYPEREFHWVFGSDSTQTMREWKEGQWLIDNVNVLAVNRTGYPVNPAIKNVTLLHLPESDVSSTLVRERATAGEDYSALVIPTIHALVENIWCAKTSLVH